MTCMAALGSGLTGALTLTAVHETARQQLDQAPRLDLLGMRALARTEARLGHQLKDEWLRSQALIGDLLANTAYYSLVGLGGRDGAWARGGLLGLAAGVGAVALPGKLNLGDMPTNRSPVTQLMTVGWYLLGGLAAGVAYEALAD